MQQPFQVFSDPKPAPKRRSGWRVLFFWVRFLLLAGTFAMTAWLVHLNRKHDPRFYWFMRTAPGQWLTNGPLAPKSPKSPRAQDGPLSDEERADQRRMEAEMAGTWPTHRLRLRDGRTLDGRVVQQNAREIVLEERVPRAGSIQSRWPTSKVEKILPYPEPPPPVLARDVRFQRQLPELHYFRAPPFTMLTDQTVFDAGESVEQLRRLHRELRGVFAPLITATNMEDGVQLLFFSEEEAYQRYCSANAPQLEHSAGFYSPLSGRLALFNQRSADHVASAQAQLAKAAAEAERGNLSAAQRKYLQSQVRAIRTHINRMADDASTETLRHEGAHQFLHQSGVHSRFYAENSWLLEGLATWCETDPVGSTPKRLRQDVADLGGPRPKIPWADLFAHRSPSGFFAFTDEDRIASAYTQSWLAVHWMMQPVRRDDFFAYLRFLRGEENVWEVSTTPGSGLLLRFLGMGEAELADELDAYGAELSRGAGPR